MTKRTLRQLYDEHAGKVSDKWSIYFDEYDHILDSYRNKPVRLLEIGIQNGGSLEIWSVYFPNAQKLIGCDINPDCALLSYEDPRIAVAVGNANSDSAEEAILAHAPAFDVIIDDGSHRSSDIVKSFARYFPHLADGGVFIAEDLHCSYWEDYEGGLFDPFSSITFFKRLADVISHEHWGVEKGRTNILDGFFAKYGFRMGESELQHIHSVEFVNSMCVIRKAEPDRNRLGTRIIAGATEMVEPGHLGLKGSQRSPAPALDQTGNIWAARSMPPDEELLLRVQDLAVRDKEIDRLHHAVVQRDEKIVSLHQTVLNRDGQIANLHQEVVHRDGQIADLHRAVQAYQASLSWRLTRPLRFIGRQIRRSKQVLILMNVLFSNRNELKDIVLRIYRRDGFRGIEERLKLLQSDQGMQLARYHGLSVSFIRALAFFAGLLLRFKQWWFANDLRKRLSERALCFWRGETKSSRELNKGPIRFHVDSPKIGLINFIRNQCVVSGWAVNLEARSAAKVRLVVGRIIYHPQPNVRVDVQRAFGSGFELSGTGFSSALTLSVGFHRLRIEVEGVNGAWIPVRRALLLRIFGSPIQRIKPRLPYSAWIRLGEKRLKAELPDIQRHINVMIHKPLFTVVVKVVEGGAEPKETIQSIRKQIYPYYEIRMLTCSNKTAWSLFDDLKSLKDTSLSVIAGEFVVFLQSGQRLAANALYEFAAALNQYTDADLIYADEDSYAPSGSRYNPFYKPEWSPDYLETFNYIGFPACFRAEIARVCFENSHLYDFILRFTELTPKVFHIAKVLGHAPERRLGGKGERSKATELDIAALSGRLERTGRRGSIREHELHTGCYNIQLELKHWPMVSIIIPTAGKTVKVGERLINLIENVVTQIRDRSTYKNIEIIVVDNGDLTDSQIRTLTDAACKRITYADPIFNISKKLNLGVSIANGELLMLMNDDIEILTPSWIERLLEHFEKPHVGVVGAKLLYPNEKTQHVGVVHNFGNPDHVRRFFPKDDSGYFFSTCGVRNYSAVTGACMMTPASVYRQVGGYSDELAVSFNDIDYCLKVRSTGLWVVYAASVELIHMESLSRVASLDIGELMWYQQRWAAELVSDPFYNERFLAVAPPTFAPCINKRML